MVGVCKCVCPPGYAGVKCEEDETAALENPRCRTTLTETTGVIQSPNYPSNYDNNEKCAWLIQVSVIQHPLCYYCNISVDETKGASKFTVACKPGMGRLC